MRGPKISDYDNDRDAYESATCNFEADEDTERERQRDEKQENEKEMQSNITNSTADVTGAGQQKGCQQCGAPFQPKNYNQVFCSADCRKRSTYDRSNNPEIQKDCVICARSFSTTRVNQRFCSPGCAKIYQNKNRRVSLPSSKRCVVCNKEFTPNRYNAAVCGDDCRIERAVRRAVRIKALEADALRAVFGDEDI